MSEETTTQPTSEGRERFAEFKTVEGIQKHPLFNTLTLRQQKFLLSYIESAGDRLWAVKQAYRVASDKSAEGQCRKLLREYAIRQLLAIYYGYEIEGSALSRTELLSLISSRLRNPDTTDEAFNRLSEKLIDLKGWEPRKRVNKKAVIDAGDKDKDSSVSVDAIVAAIQKQRGQNAEED